MQAAQQMHQHMHSLHVGSPLGHGRALHPPGLWLRQHRRAGVRPCRADLQDVVVGGAVLASIGAALYYGTKGEPEVCPLCRGVGGTTCFACGGSGGQKAVEQAEGAGRKRDFVGRTTNPSACRVCAGSGMNLCSKCRGSGFSRTM